MLTIYHKKGKKSIKNIAINTLGKYHQNMIFLFSQYHQEDRDELLPLMENDERFSNVDRYSDWTI